MKVVFVTTCKNRASHLAQTLPRNLADNPRSTFVVLAYNDETDELLDVVWPYRDDPRVRIYQYLDDARTFRMAHAKNVAHRLGMLENPDVIVNLDADNYLHVGYEAFVEDMFTHRKNLFLWAGIVKGQGRKLRGVSGRIAVTPSAFLKAGGYDERFSTWAHDDKDFNQRLQFLGYEPVETPRLLLESIPHGDGMRFREYPHACREGYDDPIMPPCETVVVNFGNFGCGEVLRIDGETIKLEPLPTRIFGIGLHKTATTSLHKALKILGYDAAHWTSGAWAREIWDEMKTRGRSQLLESVYAVTDLPIPLLYKELDKAYPGSKFILTVRDEEDWLRSVERHFSYENPYRHEWDVYPFSNRIHKALYGTTRPTREQFLATYRRHNAEVIEHFKGRYDLLIINLSSPYSWRDICQFLDRPNPGIAFPREYVTP